MNRVAKQNGFTIIELMLAMTFVSVLLLAIALTIVQIGTIYNKGITLKEVNQAGRSISDDLRRSISSSASFSPGSNVVNTPAGGRLCTGQFSYVWNYAAALIANEPSLIRFEGSNPTEIRLLKVPDSGRLYCSVDENSIPTVSRIRPVDAGASVELLKSGDRTLSIHQFGVTQSDTARAAAGQQLVSVTFTIGTGDVAALTADRTTCSPPGALGANFAYCAVQQFNLVIRAGNGVN